MPKICEDARVLHQRSPMAGIYDLTLSAPTIARSARPGQFVEVTVPHSGALLRRPLCIAETSAEEGAIRIIYRVVGRGTELLAAAGAGEMISVLGPLGHGFNVTYRHPLLVGGGMGLAPLLFFAAAMLIGLAVGLVNGYIIARFRFPALIVTLGTSSICFGIMQGVFKSREYPLCAPLYELGQMKLFSVTNPVSGLTSDMPVGIILMLLLIFLGWFILNRTMLGRGIYAIGGDVKAAQRAGFQVFRTIVFIYAFSGCMAGLIGVLRSTMLLAVHPNNLEGIELTVIAACVLGGVRMEGGKGTVWGALLGMALLTVMDNSLILLDISTTWQKVFTGAVIIIGTAVSAVQMRRNTRRLTVQVSDEEGGKQ